MFTPFGRRPSPPDAHDGRSRANRPPLRASFWLAGLLVASFVLSAILAPGFERSLSFLPHRLLNPGDLPEFALGLLTLTSHALIHADPSHLVLNLCMVLPFAAILERRFGPAAMLRVFWGSVAAGVLTHLAVYGGSHGLMGASAGASGLLGAWMRSKVRNGWAFFALAALWIAANHPRGLGVAESVSWQAHLGGFLAGLALVPASPPESPESAAEAPEASDGAASQEGSSSGR